MATFMLIEGNIVNAANGEEVTFQLVSTQGGQVPVTVPVEVFGTNNHFTLQNPDTPSAIRTVLMSTQPGSYQVTWMVSDTSTSAVTGSRRQGTIRIGSASAA